MLELSISKSLGDPKYQFPTIVPSEVIQRDLFFYKSYWFSIFRIPNIDILKSFYLRTSLIQE